MKHSRPHKLLRTQRRDHHNCLGTRHTKRGKHLSGIGRGVGTLLRKYLAVERGKRWVGFVQRSLKAHMIPLKLNIAHMADLLNGTERLTRNALPRGWSPILELRGNSRIVRLKLLWK